MLRATPKMGSNGEPLEFVAWNLAPTPTTATCVPAANFPDCVIVVTNSMTAAAAFKRFMITIGPNMGSGVGTVVMSDASRINCGIDCTENVDQDESITLTAAADPSSEFLGWQGTPTECTGTGPCTFRVFSARTIRPNFNDQFTLRVTHTQAGGTPGGWVNAGTVATPPVELVRECQATSCDATVQSGTNVMITANPRFGALFAFTGACATGGPALPPPLIVGNTCTLPMTARTMTVGVAFR
jgi:hypothetical protein